MGKPDHPLWAILKEQGRHKGWLAKQIEYSHGHVRRVSCGAEMASAEFRQRCARVLGIPEAILFLPECSTVEHDDRQQANNREPALAS